MSTINPRAGRQRHFSSPDVPRPLLQSSRSLPASLVALDLRLRSTALLNKGEDRLPHTLASLRVHVLSYLSDLEARLTLLDFASVPISIPRTASPNADKAATATIVEEDESEHESEDDGMSVEDARLFVRHGVDLLHSIRADVYSYLPELDFDFGNGSDSLRSHLPDFDFNDVKSHLPVFSDFDFEMPTMDGLRSRISEITPSSPLSYLPTLQSHLSKLQAHVQDLPSPACSLPSISPPKVLSDLLADLLAEDTEEIIQADIQRAKEEEETMQVQIKRALVKSDGGRMLIMFRDLPSKWQNNEYIFTGYRFIPGRSWPQLLLSVFKLHNETLNIHTHLIPLISLISLTFPYVYEYIVPTTFARAIAPWASTLPQLSFLRSSPSLDTLPAVMFTLSAACCLLSSVIWHIFAGCSNEFLVEGAARGDYVGIGWLISASVATMVYHGFNCQPTHLTMYTSLSILTGLAGSVVPFQGWFNERRNKKWRIVFFLVLCFTSILPLAHLSLQKGLFATIKFLLPILPSLLSYIAGLVCYATHFPECVFPGRFDLGGSHTLWHIFIIIAIRAHWVGISRLSESQTFVCVL